MSPREYKIELIVKDVETAFQAANRSFAEIAAIRALALTVALAFIGLLATLRSQSLLVVLPLVVFLTIFMLFEGGARLTLDFDVASLREAEAIFMETDPAKFTEMIDSYLFRDLRLAKEGPPPRPLSKRIRMFFNRSTLLWYVPMMLVAFGMQIAIVRGLI